MTEREVDALLYRIIGAGYKTDGYTLRIIIKHLRRILIEELAIYRIEGEGTGNE